MSWEHTVWGRSPNVMQRALAEMHARLKPDFVRPFEPFRPRTPQEAESLTRLRANPDDLCREPWADWLESRGELARAQLVRRARAPVEVDTFDELDELDAAVSIGFRHAVCTVEVVEERVAREGGELQFDQFRLDFHWHRAGCYLTIDNTMCAPSRLSDAVECMQRIAALLLDGEATFDEWVARGGDAEDDEPPASDEEQDDLPDEPVPSGPPSSTVVVGFDLDGLETARFTRPLTETTTLPPELSTDPQRMKLNIRLIVISDFDETGRLIDQETRLHFDTWGRKLSGSR